MVQFSSPEKKHQTHASSSKPGGKCVETQKFDGTFSEQMCVSTMEFRIKWVQYHDPLGFLSGWVMMGHGGEFG